MGVCVTQQPPTDEPERLDGLGMRKMAVTCPDSLGFILLLINAGMFVRSAAGSESIPLY